MNTGVLIPDPVLDDRNEMARITAALHRTANLNLEDVQFDLEVLRQAELMLLAGGDPPEQLIPGITSMRPGEPPYILISELARLPTEMLFRINQVPNKMRIAFLRLLNTTLIAATAATTTLRFTKLDSFLNQEVTIPEGTVVASLDQKFRVVTPELVIPVGVATGEIVATSLTEGNIGRIPVGTIGAIQSAIGGILSVSNITALAGGRDAESVSGAVIRARESMRIGLHLGSADDYITHIFLNILRGLGRVTPFEFFRGDFSEIGPGYLLLAVQGEDGLAASVDQINEIAAVIAQRHVAGISVVNRSPIFKSFSLNVEITSTQSESDTLPLIEQAKRALKTQFGPLRFPYGITQKKRAISLSDVVGAIESAAPQQLNVKNTGGRFNISVIVNNEDDTTSTFTEDVPLLLGELPALDIEATQLNL